MNFKVPEKLAYVAGRFEERGRLSILKNDNLRISLRTYDNLPMELKENFGGTCFGHGQPLRNWYRVQGEEAAVLLEQLLPYLIIWKEAAHQILTHWKQRGQGSK